MLHLRFVFMAAFPLVLMLLLQFSPPADGFIIRLITETLQNNVAGEPVLHERTSWDFDPEAAKRARSLYYEKNGFRSSKFIERLGVGLDGRHEERRAEQGHRDVGRLNGEHNVNYPPPPA
ncbi:uncharacterized protein LOC6615273 [Drosophila sechellia]|uniref:GM15767 n=2 Tax=melanogaster subgroup TaxID=32351 RepID=B4I7G7_DROSE|nr:uncharacterized protein LOC6615273 [Drosophila sechellia]XP_033155196.1 uncharacterized protein LOC117137729 [Drosophila mauritiana]EDW56542.1 GM15767 [Drosophila sechellia]